MGTVGPSQQHPLSGLDRDAGVSATLGDGSMIWLFGDTAERNRDGSVRFFEIGSAGWATAEDPTVTLDHVSGDRVEPFADPTDEFPPCPQEAPEGGMWPLAAVSDPTDVNRVILWMANVCLGADRALVDHGISVGEWNYDPDDPPTDRPIKVEVLEQNLFADAAFGDAAVVFGDDIVVYGCTAPTGDENGIDDAGSCRAAMVDPTEVADATAYRVWTGSGWRRDATAVSMTMEASGGPAPATAPPGSVSVSAAPAGEGFVMLYTPWPGFGPTVSVRVADSPTGPWSAPARIDLPDCEVGRHASEACYAANLQPHFFEEGSLALGYYDRDVSDVAVRGGYLLARVPFETSGRR